MTIPKEDPAGKSKIHPGWMTLLFGLGIVITATPFYMGGIGKALGSDALGIWQSILTNIGTTLIMAGVLLFFEPKLRKVVTATVKTATEAATSSMREGLRKEVQNDIDKKVGSLQEQINAVLKDGLAVQDQKVAGFLHDYSYATAREAMEAAAEYKCLNNDEIIIQATDVPGELRIGMRLAIPEHFRYSGLDLFQHPTSDLELQLVGYTAAKNWQSYVKWDDDDNFGTAVEKLMGELERAAVWGRAAVVDWEAVQKRLVDGLVVATKSSRKEPGSTLLEGRLIEVIGIKSPWYLTEQSIECPDHDYVLPRKAFPKIHTTNVFDRRLTKPDIEQPEWADSKMWDYAMERGLDAFAFNVPY